MTDLPEPLVSAEVDLRDFPFTPMFRARLFGSSFHARVSDGGWRAGVTLWLKSWDQSPAGTLPDNEIDLCRLAELAKDMKAWNKVRTEALWGWVRCSDGRLHHPVVATGVNEAWRGKLAQRKRTEAARAAQEAKRILKQGEKSDDTDPVTGRVTDPVTPAVTGSKRKGEGKGQEDSKEKPLVFSKNSEDEVSDEADQTGRGSGGSQSSEFLERLKRRA